MSQKYLVKDYCQHNYEMAAYSGFVGCRSHPDVYLSTAATANSETAKNKWIFDKLRFIF